jgi:hypothetical protein
VAAMLSKKKGLAAFADKRYLGHLIYTQPSHAAPPLSPLPHSGAIA